MTTTAWATLPEIIVTRRDRARLNGTIADYAPIVSWDAVRFLQSELERARVVDVDRIPPTNVTMGSQVEILERDTGRTRLATLVYPGEQGRYRDAVSILTPLGAALLGLGKSQAITYVDGGVERTVEVLRILHQPEAQRRFKRTRRREELPPAG